MNQNEDLSEEFKNQGEDQKKLDSNQQDYKIDYPSFNYEYTGSQSEAIPQKVQQLQNLNLGQEDQMLGVGLENPGGEQNCFLNVVFQSFWNLTSFRNMLLQNEFQCKLPSEQCLICCLKELFEEYQSKCYQKDQKMTVSKLRVLLENLYQKQEFKQKTMCDAAEAFDALLVSIHNNVTNCLNDCPQHSLFQCQLCEQNICQCRATSEPQPYDKDTNMFTLYTQELVQPNLDAKSHLGKIFEFNQKALQKVFLPICPSEDQCIIKQSFKSIIMMNSPAYFLINLVWDTKQPAQLYVLKSLALIPLNLRLSDLFQNGSTDNYSLKGLIVFFGAHYICYFRTSQNKWRYYNDVIIQELEN